MVVATIFSEFGLVLHVAMAAAAHDTAEGAVVTAAGGAADNLQWSCMWCSRIISVELQVDSSDDFSANLICAAAQ